MSESSMLARKQSRVTSFGRLYELLTVTLAAAFLFLLIGGFGLWGFVVAAALLALAIVPYQTALRYAAASNRLERIAVKARVRRAASLNYQVTRARLEVLEEAKVPGDVRNALKELMSLPPLPEGQFLTSLALDPSTGLGWERTNEFKETILKYTKHEHRPLKD